MPYRLERTTFIPRPQQEVFAFFSEAANLERITPPFLGFEIVTPQPIAMKPGTLIDYRIKLFGVPMYWKTLIKEYEPISHFVDVQLKGPYRLWHHRHEFTSVPDGTQMRDQVDYELPFGPLGTIARTLFVRRTLDKIFDYRTSVIQDIFQNR
ncbi:MAG TPA: SRPBCC family protein [Edaphobacter sp.]|nr:SRPBCC family protein [Edaphobacter sp.]